MGRSVEDQVTDRIMYFGANGKVFETNVYQSLTTGLRDRKQLYDRLNKQTNPKFEPSALISKIDDEQEDRKFGTDVIWKNGKDRIRIDLTLDFEHKDHMPFMYESEIKTASGEKIKYGIRHGNNHQETPNGPHYTEFKRVDRKTGTVTTQPVIVIGVDMDSDEFYRDRRQEKDVFTVFREKATSILQTAEYIYREFSGLDDDPEDPLEPKLKPRKTNDSKAVKNSMSEPLRKLYNLAGIRQELYDKHTQEQTDTEVEP